MTNRNSIGKRRPLGRGKLEQQNSPKSPAPTQPPAHPRQTAKHQVTTQSAPMAAKTPNAIPEQESFFIQARINLDLFETISNVIRSAITAADFRYGSISDFVRESLESYRKKELSLAPPEYQSGPKRAITLQVNRETKTFWESLPNRYKSHILNRLLRKKLTGS